MAGMSTLDYYALLEVPRTASLDDIKKAFRKKALLHHPDTQGAAGGHSEGLSPFNDLVAAYETLSDPDKRVRYDALQAVQSAMRHMHTQRAKRQTRFTQTEERKSPENPQFKCLSASFTLSLEEIFHGAARTLQWSHRTPHGDSIQEALKVQIPPGWPKEGQKLNLEGKTDAGGKHFIQVQLLLEPSKEHRLEGNDLVWRMHLYPWEFILGCQPKLDGLSKPIVVQIPPHSRPEQRLRLKGMGLPLSDGTKGDLWIELALRWPSELNHFQKTALEHLKTLY